MATFTMSARTNGATPAVKAAECAELDGQPGPATDVDHAEGQEHAGDGADDRGPQPRSETKPANDAANG